MKKILSQLIRLIKQFVKFLFTPLGEKPVEESFSKEVIGTALFDGQQYFFVREGKKVFLVGDTDQRCYRQEIMFSHALSVHAHTMKDLDAVTLPNGEHALVCTLKIKENYKTVYLVSKDTIHFKASSMVKSPEGTPTKIVINEDGNIALVTSIDGEICYRPLNLDDREIKYHSTSLSPRDNSFDHSPLRVVGTFVLPDGIFVLYDASYELRGYQTHRFGGALLAHDNLGHVHWRAFFDEIPFWEKFISRKDENVSFATLGAYLNDDMIKVYFYEKINQDIFTLDLHEPYSRRDPNSEKAILRKYINNPILEPNPEHSWEANAVFNPAAIQLGNTTHLLYRAEGTGGLSVIGYGKSYNGVTFDTAPDPVYVPRMDFEGVNVPFETLQTMRRATFKSGYRHYPKHNFSEYEWHGVEDPRITEVDGRIYMIYAAFDGYHYARPAITSIDKEDFLAQKWNWDIPQVMTKQVHIWGSGNKNIVLHPEKVNGKFMLYHRLWPHIRIDFVDDLEFGPGKKYIKELARIEARGDSWDSNRVGVSAPPLLIDEGWLLIYQGSGSQDKRYKVGAMILDRDDPTKTLYRSSYPIMAPSEWYEGGIAYACGAIIRDGKLFVYYGGNDKYVCTAIAPLEEFVEKLKRDPYTKPDLQKTKNIDDLCI